MVLSRLFHRINLSISAAVLSLAAVMPGEAAAITLDFTEYAGNFGIYGGIDATLDVTVNNRTYAAILSRSRAGNGV
jgi:hypothetical protein